MNRTTPDWRRLAHIREQQERFARLKLAAAQSQLRAETLQHNACREQAAQLNAELTRCCGQVMLAAEWAAATAESARQHVLLQELEARVAQARAITQQTQQAHQQTVQEQEIVDNLMQKQLSAERREAWHRLQLQIDEHSVSRASNEPETSAVDSNGLALSAHPSA